MTREEAIEQLKVYRTCMSVDGAEVEAYNMAIQALGQEPKTGHWIEHFDESGKWYECDQCHTDWGGSVNYCPNCGAKMKGGE